MEEIKNTENSNRIDTDKFPCRQCGGNMVFNPELGSLYCPYCNHKAEIENEDNEIQEYDFDSIDEAAAMDWGRETKVIHCNSCGADTVLEANNTAQFCAFCGSSHIVKQDECAGIVPESLIPFKVSQDKAVEQFKKWIKRRFYAPNALKKKYHTEKLKGVYIPHWTYDTNTDSSYTAEKGTYYYVNETRWVNENGKRVSKTERVRKTRWEFVSGYYSEFFNDVVVNGSKKLDKGIIDSFSFDLSQLIGYKPEYLSGFLAERYSVDVKEGWNIAKQEIDLSIRAGVKRKINGDEVRNLSVRTQYNNRKYKHILLPIWISAYKYKNKLYSFMVSGQTGEVRGHAPISVWKVLLTILVTVGVVAGMIYFFKSS